MRRIGDIKAGFLIEDGRQEVLTGYHEIAVHQEQLLRGLVASASTSLWGVSWVWVGRSCASLEREHCPEGGRVIRSELLGEGGG